MKQSVLKAVAAKTLTALRNKAGHLIVVPRAFAMVTIDGRAMVKVRALNEQVGNYDQWVSADSIANEYRPTKRAVIL